MQTAPKFFRNCRTRVKLLLRDAGPANLTAGVNTGRIEAYQMVLARGFKTEMQGVTMHRPNESGYSRPGFVIDDWR